MAPRSLDSDPATISSPPHSHPSLLRECPGDAQDFGADHINCLRRLSGFCRYRKLSRLNSEEGTLTATSFAYDRQQSVHRMPANLKAVRSALLRFGARSHAPQKEAGERPQLISLRVK